MQAEEIQRVLFDCLLYFKSMCEKNSLTYYLSNGTLLGAAKYGGFVPWDDDADVLMPREDYEKLLGIKEVDNSFYRLHSLRASKKWRLPYTKLSDVRTLLKEGNYNFGEKLGVSLDIFPLDKWNPHKFIAHPQSVYSELLKRMLSYSLSDNFETVKAGLKKSVLKCIWNAGHLLGYEKIGKLIDAELRRSRKYPKVLVGCVAWTCHNIGDVLPAKLFERSTEISFCGEKFAAPIGYKTYLKSLYGNWCDDLAPEQQRSNHCIKAWWKT